MAPYGTVTQTLSCEQSTTSATSTGDPYPAWDPSSYISYNAGIYQIDEALVDMLKEDGAPLFVIDSAHIVDDDPYFHLEGVQNGDLVDALGLQNDDTLLSVSDGAAVWGLETLQDYWVAIDALKDHVGTITLSVSDAQDNTRTLTYERYYPTL